MKIESDDYTDIGLRYADDGETVLAVQGFIFNPSPTTVTLYIRKDGENLIVYSSLSDTSPKTATPITVSITSYYHTYKLGEKTAAIELVQDDWDDWVTALTLTDGDNTSVYYYRYSYYSDDNYAMCFENRRYESIYVRVTENSDGSITISIGSQKDEQEGDEKYTWENSIPLPPLPPPPPPAPPLP